MTLDKVSVLFVQQVKILPEALVQLQYQAVLIVHRENLNKMVHIVAPNMFTVTTTTTSVWTCPVHPSAQTEIDVNCLGQVLRCIFGLKKDGIGCMLVIMNGRISIVT